LSRVKNKKAATQ